MALINRTDLPGQIDQLLSGEGLRVFLFFGERYLCRKAVAQLEAALLGSQTGTVSHIDGEQEDEGQTLSKLMSFSLLPGLQIYQINDTRLFHSKDISKTLWQKAHQAFKADRQNLAVKYLADMHHLASIPAKEWQPLTELSEKQWQELFGMTKPADLKWTESLNNTIEQRLSIETSAGSMAQKYMEAFDRGLPPDNVVILSAETIDKRKRLYTYLKKNGLVVDCSVAEGSTSGAQKVQKAVLNELMKKTLDEFGKTINTKAQEVFLERVGFHPVAVVNEMEKLALYCDDHSSITLQDLDTMVGRSREDALFELTDHFSKRQLGKSLTTLHRLLENGIHNLAILTTLRNFVARLLLFRSIQLHPSPVYQRGIGARQFQESYLPAIREKEEWKDALKGHPYALFMSFSKAAEYQCSTLKRWLELILDAEYSLKGSNLPPNIVLEQLLVTMIKGLPASSTN